MSLSLYETRINENKCRCSRCKNIYDASMFCKSDLKIKHAYCRKCRRKSSSDSRQKCILKKKYNLSLDQYEQLLISQQYKCAICRNSENHINFATKKIISLTVDHCHKTGTIRGLLCRNCNLMLGNSKDSPENLKKGAKYLENAKIKLKH